LTFFVASPFYSTPAEDLPSTARVQAALRKPNKLGLADTYTGQWALDDPEFAA